MDQVINRVKAFVVEHFAEVDTNDLLDARYSATGVENVLKEVFGEEYASFSLSHFPTLSLLYCSTSGLFEAAPLI